MNIRSLLIFGELSAGQMAMAQKVSLSVPRTMNLQQAVELALVHNHDVRISSLKVEEEEHAKELARSAYLPVLRNDTSFLHVTDTQFIEIAAGSLGSAGPNPIPPRDHILNQGGRNIFTSGTGLTQPLTQLFKIKAENDVCARHRKSNTGALWKQTSSNSSVPFLAPNFGTFGVHASYDIFDGGKKRAMLRERETQLGQANENLARTSDQIEVKVQTAYNKLERTEKMLAVSQELLAARQEARRVSAQGLERGTHLRSQAEAAEAQESEAQSVLLQSQLEYVQAQDELNEAMGQTAND
jgi:outer membrane protein TolC